MDRRQIPISWFAGVERTQVSAPPADTGHMSAIAHEDSSSSVSGRRRRPRRLGRHPVPQRGGEHRGMRAPGARCSRYPRHSRRGDRRRQRFEGRQRPVGGRRRRHRRPRTPSRLRQRVQGWFPRRSWAVHRDGGRRPHLRLQRDPSFRRGIGERRRHGDRQPHAEHPSRSDALASPLHRQPAAVRLPQPALPHRRRRRSLRHAGAAAGRAAQRSICAPPGWSSPPRW